MRVSSASAVHITDEIHADAAIGAAMQVKRRLRSTPCSRLRLRLVQPCVARGVRDPRSAVIADRRRQARARPRRTSGPVGYRKHPGRRQQLHHPDDQGDPAPCPQVAEHVVRVGDEHVRVGDRGDAIGGVIPRTPGSSLQPPGCKEGQTRLRPPCGRPAYRCLQVYSQPGAARSGSGRHLLCKRARHRSSRHITLIPQLLRTLAVVGTWPEGSS
jgi:hypothetical protein